MPCCNWGPERGEGRRGGGEEGRGGRKGGEGGIRKRADGRQTCQDFLRLQNLKLTVTDTWSGFQPLEFMKSVYVQEWSTDRRKSGDAKIDSSEIRLPYKRIRGTSQINSRAN